MDCICSAHCLPCSKCALHLDSNVNVGGGGGKGKENKSRQRPLRLLFFCAWMAHPWLETSAAIVYPEEDVAGESLIQGHNPNLVPNLWVRPHSLTLRPTRVLNCLCKVSRPFRCPTPLLQRKGTYVSQYMVVAKVWTFPTGLWDQLKQSDQRVAWIMLAYQVLSIVKLCRRNMLGNSHCLHTLNCAVYSSASAFLEFCSWCLPVWLLPPALYWDLSLKNKKWSHCCKIERSFLTSLLPLIQLIWGHPSNEANWNICFESQVQGSSKWVLLDATIFSLCCLLLQNMTFEVRHMEVWK